LSIVNLILFVFKLLKFDFNLEVVIKPKVSADHRSIDFSSNLRVNKRIIGFYQNFLTFLVKVF